LFEEVTEALFPDDKFFLRSKSDPQDNRRVELKQEFNFEQEVAKETEKFILERESKCLFLKDSIVLGKRNRKEFEDSLVKLVEFKESSVLFKAGFV